MPHPVLEQARAAIADQIGDSGKFGPIEQLVQGGRGTSVRNAEERDAGIGLSQTLEDWRHDPVVGIEPGRRVFGRGHRCGVEKPRHADEERRVRIVSECLFDPRAVASEGREVGVIRHPEQVDVTSGENLDDVESLRLIVPQSLGCASRSAAEDRGLSMTREPSA